MGLFGGKKKQRRRLYPYDRERILRSREYRLYKRGEHRRLHWYERLVSFSEKLITITPDKQTAEKITSAINFTGMRITPAGVTGLFVLTLLLFALGSIPIFLWGALIGAPNLFIVGMFFIAFGLLVAYYLYKYPMNYVKQLRIRASAHVVLAVLYMVVSMRISPNLERALRFAAANITGPLAWDMRRLLWDIEMRRYASADEALTDYIARWKPENEEFAEALRLIRNSESQLPEKAEKVLDEALNVVLEGTKVRMKHYAQDLKLPVMVIHMMGIVLPVMGTIMAPLAAVFISDLVRPEHFIIGYDIALPIIILWFINNTLNKRPITFSAVDISHHPDLPRPGRFSFRGRSIPVLPVSILVFLPFLLFPLLYFAAHPDVFFPKFENDRYVAILDPNPLTTMVMSLLLILGFGLAFALYHYLSNFQRVGIQTDIQDIESKFELALFQLGNRISGGVPTEVAIEKSIEDIKDLKLADLFRLTLRNIRNLGMTFEQALFDRQYGALRYYPSKLIRNIMLAVVDTSRKGVAYAAESMLRISAYLRNIRETQEYIREILSDTVSSMKFQAYFLTPLITGLIVAMADVIIQVLGQLGEYLQGIGANNTLGLDFAALTLGSPSITPAIFQLIVGVYLLQAVAILSLFLTKINHGDDPIRQWKAVGETLMVAVIVYFLVALGASAVFGDLIRNALSGLTST